MSRTEVTILGLGNILMQDEGIGVHIANLLNDKFVFTPPITIIDGGTTGADLLTYFENSKKVLIIDDIFDEGNTLAAIKGSVEQRKAASVRMAVLVRKHHDRGLPRDYVDFVGMDVPDVYVYGAGMDAYEEWRHLDHILALEED